MKNSEKIKSVSRIFKMIFFAMMFVVPIFFLTIWGSYNYLPASITKGLFSPTIPFVTPLKPDQIFAGLLVSLIPLSITLAGFYFLAKLFKLYEAGNFFTLQNAQCYKNLAWVYVFKSGGNIIYNSLLSFVLTMHNPPGKRILTFGLGSDDLAHLLISGIILVISWVMIEAVRLQEENTYTI